MMSLKRKLGRKFSLLRMSAMMLYTCLALLMMSRYSREVGRLFTLRELVGDPGPGPGPGPGGQRQPLEPPAPGDSSSFLGSNQELGEDQESVTGRQEEEEEDNGGRQEEEEEQQEEDSGGRQDEELEQQEEDNGGEAQQEKDNRGEAQQKEDNTGEAQQEEDNTGEAQQEEDNRGEAQQEEDNTGEAQQEEDNTGEAQQEEDNGGEAQQKVDNGSQQQKQAVEAPPSPLLVLLLSSMPRSGSTLLTEVLSVQQESIVFFEPLWLMQKDQCSRDGQCVAQHLAHVFNCSYEQDFENWLKAKHVFLQFFNADAKRCLKASDKEVRDSCVHDLSLREMCLTSPVRIIKVIRARLSWLVHLLRNPQLNLKVIHLARDPRASLTSIARFKDWNKNPYDRCVGLQEDLEVYDELAVKFPSQLLQVYYEDLCLDPASVTSGIYSFLYGDSRLPKAVTEYIATHMTQESGKQSMSTYKDSKKEFEAWRYKISPWLLQSVEEEPTCLRSIQRMRHTVFTTTRNARNSRIPLFVSDK